MPGPLLLLLPLPGTQITSPRNASRAEDAIADAPSPRARRGDRGGATACRAARADRARRRRAPRATRDTPRATATCRRRRWGRARACAPTTRAPKLFSTLNGGSRYARSALARRSRARPSALASPRTSRFEVRCISVAAPASGRRSARRARRRAWRRVARAIASAVEPRAHGPAGLAARGDLVACTRCARGCDRRAMRPGRLEHRRPSRGDRLARLAARARPLDEHRLDGLAHEEPLHARLGILDERLHEEPFALDVEAEKARARPTRGRRCRRDEAGRARARPRASSCRGGDRRRAGPMRACDEIWPP